MNRPIGHTGRDGRVEFEAHAATAGERFAEAVVMLARLPLTDAERAEVVRRLLADQGGLGKP